jgi:hypothetical protein
LFRAWDLEYLIVLCMGSGISDCFAHGLLIIRLLRAWALEYLIVSCISSEFSSRVLHGLWILQLFPASALVGLWMGSGFSDLVLAFYID